MPRAFNDSTGIQLLDARVAKVRCVEVFQLIEVTGQKVQSIAEGRLDPKNFFADPHDADEAIYQRRRKDIFFRIEPALALEFLTEDEDTVLIIQTNTFKPLTSWSIPNAISSRTHQLRVRDLVEAFCSPDPSKNGWSASAEDIEITSVLIEPEESGNLWDSAHDHELQYFSSKGISADSLLGQGDAPGMGNAALLGVRNIDYLEIQFAAMKLNALAAGDTQIFAL